MLRTVVAGGVTAVAVALVTLGAVPVDALPTGGEMVQAAQDIFLEIKGVKGE